MGLDKKPLTLVLITIIFVSGMALAFFTLGLGMHYTSELKAE
jgi:hypothetical protein